MPKIIYLEHDGTEHPIEVELKMTLMEGATLNMVPGIDAVCGGMCSCATCHCYIANQEFWGLNKADDDEREVLNLALQGKHSSRLSCQIEVTEKMEGLRVQMPQTQT